MRIRSIFVRNFRKLTEPLHITGLGDGMTVIAGDNEDGKSTLLAALRAALFLKHKITGAAVEELVPYGSKVRPELRLELEFAGQPYSLYKAFYQDPRAELVTPTGKLHGSAAEEELARLLRFESPQKGAPKSEHQGLCGLLWLTQGESFLNQAPAAQLQRDLQAALEAEVGSVLTGDLGRKLLSVFREQRDQNFTKTGRPSGDLAKAQERVAALRDKLGVLTRQRCEYEEKVDRLGALTASLRRLQADAALGHEQASLTVQEQALVALQQRELALRELQRQRELLGVQLADQQERQRQRQLLREQLRRDQADVELLAEQISGLDRQRGEAQARWQDLEAELRKVRQQHEDTQAAVTALRRAGERERLERELTQLTERRQETLAKERQRAQLGESLARLLVDDKQLMRLRELAQKVRDSEVGLQAVATQLVIEHCQGGLQVDGQPAGEADAQQPLILTERTLVELPGQLRLWVTPGRTGAVEQRQQLQAHKAALRSQLDELGLADLAAAEAEHQLRSEHLQKQRELQGQLAKLCKEGLPALEAEIFRLDRKHKLLGEDASPLSVLRGEPLAQQLTAGEAELARSQQVVTELSGAVERRRREAMEAGEELAKRQGSLAAQQRSVAQLTARQKAESAQVSDEALVEATQDLQRRLAETAAQADQLAAEVAATEPERLRLRVEQLRRAVAELHQQLQSTEHKAQELAIELRTLGQVALHAEYEETTAALAKAESELSHKQRQAAAIQVLYASLQAHDRRAREAYLLPLVRMMAPYVQAILPGCRLELDQDKLAIVGLQRGEQLEPFSALSIGTREQLAVIVRLAVADLFAQRGQSVPIVLDDALVYCDDERFDRMLEILRHSAHRHQILVLTCHERAFRQAAAPLIHLTNCRSAA